MAADYYDKLSDLSILRRAWHLARNDSRADFILDPYRFADFAFRLDDNLEGIARSLRSGTYHPKPLLTIDVPKSSLSVRPGSVLSIEDKIVMFAIACLIAPHLDKKLPDAVYSWRVKKQSNKKDLFENHEILRFPFLKRVTIQRRIEFVEPWYGLWPNFIKDAEAAYKENGYRFLVLSDIVAYFENIDIGLLRDLLLHYLPRQPKIINFLINLLDYWSWPAVHGGMTKRGIPQGNGVSSFLGNIYLLPLDKAFLQLQKRYDIKYLRYMDDIKVMAKDIQVARDSLFLMNEKLRELRLNIQGAKTRILKDGEIREELFDDRLARVNSIIDKIQKKKSLSRDERNSLVDNLRIELKRVKGRRGVIGDKELRLFRRLVTGFALLRNSGMVRLVLDQLERNPDSRLIYSAVHYLRFLDRNMRTISDRIYRFLIEGGLLFPYQEANCLMTLRYQRDLSADIFREAKKLLRSKRKHWYVRQQAALLISMKNLSNRELDALNKLAADIENGEIKRALIHALAQLPKEKLMKLIQELIIENDPKIQRLGCYYNGLISIQERARERLDSLFKNYYEDALIDRMYEVEVLSKSDYSDIRACLKNNLKKIRANVHRPLIRKRIDVIISRLDKENTL